MNEYLKVAKESGLKGGDLDGKYLKNKIRGISKHSDEMQEKMEHVFEIFKEHKEYVVLLWRLHPLIPSTICAMRPQLWQKYSLPLQRWQGI